MADFTVQPELFETVPATSERGKIRIFCSDRKPESLGVDNMSADMTMKLPVTGSLRTILEKISVKYSPIKRKYFTN